MELIDKSALLAEIERMMTEEMALFEESLKDDSHEISAAPVVYTRLQMLLSAINTLEVKEVDIEDSVKETLAQKYIDYTFRRHNIDPESKEGQLIYYAYMHGMNQCLTQLRTQKRE